MNEQLIQRRRPETEFKKILRSPKIDFLESIPGLLKCKNSGSEGRTVARGEGGENSERDLKRKI